MATLDLLRRRARFLALGLSLAMTPAAFTGCAPTEDAAPGDEGNDPIIDEIANVQQSAVKRQYIGNCWLYATVGWLESLHKARTNTEINVSESYLTFWDWYGKITTGSGVSESTTNGATTRTIQTGGSWQLAVQIIKQRGVMMEGDFIAEEATAEGSQRQASAERAINAALADGGELATRESRRDGAKVLRVLMNAWGLSASVQSSLTAVFGANGAKRFDGYSTRATPGRSGIKRASDIPVRTVTRDRAGAVRSVDGTLADVMPGGRYGWVASDYPGSWNTTARPEAMRRLLRAINADQPAIVSWLVDFNALDSRGSFTMEQLRSSGRPGRQGGHLTVAHDYQVRLPDGTVLAAGVNLPAADRERALTGTVEFLQVKNSWGVSRADRASMLGYYNLTLGYMHGPISWVGDGGPTARPYDQTPLNEIIVPQGF